MTGATNKRSQIDEELKARGEGAKERWRNEKMVIEVSRKRTDGEMENYRDGEMEKWTEEAGKGRNWQKNMRTEWRRHGNTKQEKIANDRDVNRQSELMTEKWTEETRERGNTGGKENACDRLTQRCRDGESLRWMKKRWKDMEAQEWNNGAFVRDSDSAKYCKSDSTMVSFW